MLIETVPLLMLRLRKHINQQRPHGLTLPQFRLLAFLCRHPGSTLGEVASSLGLCASTTSKLAETLLQQQYLTRDIAADDRRRVALSLSPAGRETLQGVLSTVRDYLTHTLATLPAHEVEQLTHAMHVLIALFSSPQEEHDVPDTGNVETTTDEAH